MGKSEFIIGAGVDIVELARAKKLLKNFNPSEQNEGRVLGSFFSRREIDEFARSREPHKRFAESFAAKECVIKAVPGLSGWAAAWSEIELRGRTVRGRKIKRLFFSGGIAEKLAGLGFCRYELEFSEKNGEVIAALVLYGRRGNKR